MKDLCHRLQTRLLTMLNVTLQDRLVEEGYNPAYGARPLRRAIMRLLEDSMAERMLSGDIKEGDSVIIDVDADGQVRPALKHAPLVSCNGVGPLRFAFRPIYSMPLYQQCRAQAARACSSRVELCESSSGCSALKGW